MIIARSKRQSLFSLLGISLVLGLMVIGTFSSDSRVLSEMVLAIDEETEYIYYLPVILQNEPSPVISLTTAQTRNSDGIEQNIYYLWDTIQYVSSGFNSLGEAAPVDLIWSLDGPCGPTDVFSDTVILPPGEWEHTHNQTTPGCNGAFTGTVQKEHLGITSTLTTTFVVNLEQAFDRCGLPTVSQMQTWWDSSPYTVWNIYLGGIHFPCSLEDLTPPWVDSVSQQGWDFILTWVGPQAPCSDFYYTFSSYWLDAYFDGINEAQDALGVAEGLDISGEKIIYYDLEAYPDANAACREAAAFFIQGWTQELHENGVKAGGYGSPCNSYMTDWAGNLPPPDDVWIAHWLLPPQYRPDASVWNVACMANDYWPDHQRIRQYAGDHVEIWGGVPFTIDSSVVEGDTVSAPNDSAALDMVTSPLNNRLIIRAMDLISPEVGWILVGDRLLLTEDGGELWKEITPDLGGERVLDAAFLDSNKGWIAVIQGNSSYKGQTNLYHTTDGGGTWDLIILPPATGEISRAYLDFRDPQNGWLVLKLASSSSFSLGQMYTTNDEGETWATSPTPLGEPVVFVDTMRGWMVGGPSGVAVYRTLDGGLTWESQNLPGLPHRQVFIGLPHFETPLYGILPVTILDRPSPRLVIYGSDDGGESWQKKQEMVLPKGTEPGTALPFSAKSENWWAAPPASSEISANQGQENALYMIKTKGLPPGTITLDFASADHGWALVQKGGCNGDKIPGYRPDAVPLTCNLDTHLYITVDGGYQWSEVGLPGQ